MQQHTDGREGGRNCWAWSRGRMVYRSHPPRRCQSRKLAFGSSDAKLQAYPGHVGVCVDGKVALNPAPDMFQKTFCDDET